MSNTFTYVIPQLLAQGLEALRENAVMPMLVNRDYESMAAQKGQIIDIPIPSAITAVAVTPAITPPANSDVSPTRARITLNQWYEAPFYLTDKEMLECMDGTIPMQASEAIKSLANNIDSYLLGRYLTVYGYVGTAGTTPFASDVSAATAARKTLFNQLAPPGDRRFVTDTDAEANALGLRAFQDMSFSGSAQGIIEGHINRKLGFDWFMDQNVPSHTAGTAAGATTDAAGYAVGVKTITLASAGTGTILTGDIFTIAGDTQTYVVITGDADVSGGGTVVFEPGLKVAITTAATAITLKATHTVNMAFHRDAIGFAMRPLVDSASGLGAEIMAANDPHTGLALRLEVSRQHKQTRFSYDVLYGATMVRPELACRVAG